MWSRMDETVFPRKDEMMAGGASLAPSRCALVALMMDALTAEGDDEQQACEAIVEFLQ